MMSIFYYIFKNNISKKIKYKSLILYVGEKQKIKKNANVFN